MRNQEIWEWSELRLENNQRYHLRIVGIHYYNLTDDYLLTFVPKNEESSRVL